MGVGGGPGAQRGLQMFSHFMRGMSREAVSSWEKGPWVKGHEMRQRIPLGTWACGPVLSGC